ncbi:MAG: hypothetical protein N2319_08910 [Candidatus Kapabacteria bacterium]|nr:hypothetical protein [Candidatus Kapabacteria bacterium]
MKFKVSIFILIMTSSLWAYDANEFFGNIKPERITSNYNGSYATNDVILVYGDGGIIIKSIDNGNSWSKMQINDSLTIIGMIQNGSSLFALSSKRWGVLSSDNFNNCSYVDLGNYNFYQLLPYGDNIIALTDKKILIFNKSLNKTKEYDYSNDGNYYRATILGSKLFCSSGYGAITVINLENGSKNILRLSEMGICNNCPEVKNILAAPNDYVFFSLGNYLYRLNDNTSKIDTLAFIQNINTSSFRVYNDNLYYIYSRKIFSQKDSLFFFRIDYKNKKQYRVNNSPTDRYISDLSFNHINFINDNLLIAVGKNNLIYVSNDGGLNWNLKSFLGEYFYVNLFEGQYARAIGPYAIFYFSSDRGTTWLPTKSYHSELYQNFKFEYPYNYNGCFQYKDKDNGYVFFPSNTENVINTIYTNDGGQTTIKTSSTQYLNEGLSTFSLENKGKYLFFQWGCLGWGLGCWSAYRLFDNNFQLERQNAQRGSQMFYATKYDNKIYTISKDTSEPKNVYSVYYSQDDGNNWVKDFSFTIEEPMQINCRTAILIDHSIYATWDKIVISSKDTIQLQSCYEIDLINKTTRKIIETRGESEPVFVKIKDRYFFGTSYLVINNNQISVINNMFFTNDIQSQNVQWDTVKFSRYSITRLYQFIEDSLLIFNAYDKYTSSSILMFANINTSQTGVELETDKQNTSKVFLSVPMPNPSKDQVVFNLYWDQRINIDECKILLSDILGRTLSNNYAISLNKKNPYSGEINVNTSGLPSGIYMLSLTLGEEYYSQIFIVVN